MTDCFFRRPLFLGADSGLSVGATDQRAIAAKLDTLTAETQRLESIYQRKLAALDALKKSLLHQACTEAL
jgi:hypothetical protein